MTMTETTDADGVTWIADADGNRCSAKHFGSIEAAREALASLKNCRDTTNCSYCSGCSDCSRCSRCSDCSDCSRCSYCSGCSDCSDCSRCSRCSDCSRCSGCENKKGTKGDTPWVRPPTPAIPNIHRAVYEAASQPGALDMGHWHCGTTHCRGGWVVTLAGDEGKELEAATSTLHAAMLIYRASDPTWRMSNFFAGNDEALADMKRLAELGKANHGEAA